jgi:glutathione transport system substrate-binding protein
MFDHRFTRRTFVKGLSLSVGFASLSTLLAACAEDDDEVAPAAEEDDGIVEDDDDAEEEVVEDDHVGDDVDEVDDETEDDTDTAALSEGGEIRYAQNLQITDLDPGNPLDYPSSYDGLYAIYSRLVTFNVDMEFTNELAESYETSEDGTTWTFELVEGVMFHDGSDFDADAVRIHFERLGEEDPATPRPNGGNWRNYLEEIIVDDTYTVTFVMSEPLGAFINFLAHGSGGIISPQALEEYGDDIGSNPVGCGPFRVREFSPGGTLVLDAFEDYFGSRPGIDALTIEPVLESAARTVAIETGEADVIYDVPPIDAQRLEAHSDVNLIQRTSLRAYYIGLNLLRPQFEEKEVRQALNYAVDKQSIIDALFQGYATELTSPFAPGLPTHKDAKSYSYDPDLANEMLEEAGWEMGNDGVREKDGVRLEGRLLIAEGEYPQDIQVGQEVQSQLRDVGVDIELWVVEAAVRISEHMRNPNLIPTDAEYDMYFWAFNPSNGDPGAVMSQFDWRENALDQPVNNWNMMFFDNERVNELIGQGQTTTDPDEREAIYHELQDIVMDEAPYIYLYVPDTIIAVREGVNGVGLMPVAFVRFEETSQS